MIGAPVDGVRTPPLLRDYLDENGAPREVRTVEVSPAALRGFMEEVRADDSVDGLLVTMPHKKTIIPFLDGLSGTAWRSGSVNAVKRTSSSGLLGGQFDGVALVKALVAADAPLGDARVLLVGLGGAGTAIAQALVAHGCRSLDICDVDKKRTETVIGGLGRKVFAVTEPFGDRYEILINATPLGMAPGDPSPFCTDLIARASWVADIVADPARTRLAGLAKAVGTRLVTGRQMVDQQIEPIGAWLLSPDIEQETACSR